MDKGDLTMDLQAIKGRIVFNVYDIDPSRKVPLHKHGKNDEIFSCAKGEGTGFLGEERTELRPGKAFIVPACGMHTISTETGIVVYSFLVPVLE